RGHGPLPGGMGRPLRSRASARGPRSAAEVQYETSAVPSFLIAILMVFEPRATLAVIPEVSGFISRSGTRTRYVFPSRAVYVGPADFFARAGRLCCPLVARNLSGSSSGLGRS